MAQRVALLDAVLLGDVEQALRRADALVASGHATARDMNTRAALLLRLGRPKAALHDATAACRAQPGVTGYHINRALALFGLHRFDECRDACDAALTRNSRSASALLIRGRAWLAAGEAGLAAEDFSAAITYAPDAAAGYASRGRANLALGLNAEACRDLRAATDRAPDQSGTWNNLGVALLRCDRVAQADAALTRAITLEPGVARYYYNRARVREAAGDMSGAEKDYTRAVARMPSLGEAYVNRGVLRLGGGARDKGMADLRRACELGLCTQYEAYKAKL